MSISERGTRKNNPWITRRRHDVHRISTATVMTSSLGISRWKNMAQINDCGMRAVASYDGLAYWDFNWRKGGGSSRMIEISKREEFYQQEYCGCVYYLRDSNIHRRSQGREPIELGKLYYRNADEDADASG